MADKMHPDTSRAIWIGWGVALISVGLAYFLGGPFWAYLCIFAGIAIALRGHSPRLFQSSVSWPVIVMAVFVFSVSASFLQGKYHAYMVANTSHINKYEAKRLPSKQTKQSTVKIVEEPSINERFAFSIVLDRDSGKMVSIYSDHYLPRLAPRKEWFLADAVTRSNRVFTTEKQIKQHPLDAVRPPIAANEAVEFYEELFQYELIEWYTAATRFKDGGFVRSGVGGSTSGIILHVPLLPPNYIAVRGKEMLVALSKNRFIDEQVRQWWNDPMSGIPVPAHARLLIPDRQSIVIERPKYYRITFRIEPGPIRGSGVPKHLLGVIRQVEAEGLIKPGAVKVDAKTGEGFVKTSDLETLWLIVNLTATFEGLPAGSKEATEMKKWVTALFTECKQLADPEE